MLDSKFAESNQQRQPISQCNRAGFTRPKSDSHDIVVIDLTSVHSETGLITKWRERGVRKHHRISGNTYVFPPQNAYLVDALILMSTPAGRLNLFNASIVLAVAWTISINRL